VAVPVADALTQVLRSGARELLRQAVVAEVAEVCRAPRELKDQQTCQRVVPNGAKHSNGHRRLGGERPRVRDRAGGVKFESRIFANYLRRTRSVNLACVRLRHRREPMMFLRSKRQMSANQIHRVLKRK
jgi:putative transposase